MKSSEKRIEKVDQLFKNKLDDHTMGPSENAWARVEAGLSKKNNLWLGATRTVVFWRAAAAVLLMGALLSVFYWTRTDNGAEKVLAKTEPALNEKKNEPEKTSTAGSGNTVAATQNKSGIQQKAIGNQTVKQESVGNKEVAPDAPLSASRKNMMEIEKEIAQNYSIKLNGRDNAGVTNEEKINDKATPGPEVASTRQKPIKLEFTLEALPSEETVATTTEEKSTGIKKVLNLAREMKQGEGLSSLREKKDELLAHNFLTKRERNQ